MGRLPHPSRLFAIVIKNMKFSISKIVILVVVFGAIIALATVFFRWQSPAPAITASPQKLAFGKLPLPTAPPSGLASGVSGTAIETRTFTLTEPEPAAPPPMPSFDIERCLIPEGCPPESLPPRAVYSWEGSTLPELPEELSVYRVKPLTFTPELALILGIVTPTLTSLGIPNLFKGNLSLLSLSVRDDGYVWSFDTTGGVVSFWSEGPVSILEGEYWLRGSPGGETSSIEALPVEGDSVVQPFPLPRPRVTPQPPSLPNEEAIRIANEFLTSRGLDVAKYGEPHLDTPDSWPPCTYGPCPLGVGAAPRVVEDSAYPIWWQPQITVWYGGKIEGTPVVDWQGSPHRVLTVAIEASTKLVQSGSILLVPPMTSSLYPATTKEAALEEALRGGLNPYWTTPDLLPPELEARRPVVRIVFREATLALFQKVTYDVSSSDTFYLPVVAFTGILTDQYGSSFPWGTLVNALKSESFKE